MPLDAVDITALHSLPEAMRALPQWLLWRFVASEAGKKPRKVPFYVSGRRRHGGQGDDHDRAELATFDIALTHLARGRFDGLGFAFLPGDGLIGIDIDAAIDADGVIADRWQAAIDACASYTELSPSGTGVHIIVAGTTDTFKDNGVGLEVFCGRQFFTCTGRRWAGTPDQVVPISDEVLRRLKATVNAGKAKKAKPVGAVKAPAQAANDFERINAAALALLDSWVPSLFSSAKKHPGTGAWRVTSKALGRDLEEDLALHPSGIKDWGTDEGMTPIDVLVRFSGRKPAEALKWLASALGMTLSKPPRLKLVKPAGAPERADDRADGGSTPLPGSAEEGDFVEAEEADAGAGAAWRDGLLKNAEGVKKDCRENVFTFLTGHPRLIGMVAFDEFSYRIVKKRPPPWASTPGEWATSDDYELGLWLAQMKGVRLTIKSEGTLAAGVAMAANRAKFHPVRDYLAATQWDRVPRLAHWLHECLGTADTPYHQMIGRWFLLGMVNRVLNPGCQMDNMIVLEGAQGKKKSSALRVLAGEWFADTPIRIGDKDALLNLAGVWLYEVAELDAFNKAEVTAVKQYVSSRVDRVREPYSRRPMDRHRSCVLGGTTNQHEYFKDSTGSRRFWPLACDGEIDLAKLAEWRDQLFAEAVHELQRGERYHPTADEANAYILPEQESREITDPWFERIALWVDSDAEHHTASYTSSTILTGALHVPADRIDGARQMATRVGIVMKKLGWAKVRDAAGARLWRYMRPKETAAGVSPAQPLDGAMNSRGAEPSGAWSADEWEGPHVP